MILMQDMEERMGNKGDATIITTIIETTTARMRARKKGRTGSMPGPARNTMEITFGENVGSTSEVTIAKVIIGITITTTGEIRRVKDIQMQITAATGLHRVPIHASWMSMEI